ncbi:MAG: hypothetical protein AAF630_01630 [Cyanobacteria bacterium P01_C01_bin.38]
MLRRLVQATIITLLLNLIFGLSEHSNQFVGSQTKSPIDTYSEPVVSLLVRSLK